jgi:hypothetical protein
MKNDRQTETTEAATDMTHGSRRYRLTFDGNPKELARRDAGIGHHVILLWSRRTGRTAVVVDEGATGELVELDVRVCENPLELYRHPFAYIPLRGHPGRTSLARKRAGDMTKSREEVRSMAKKDEGTKEIKKGKESER